MTSVPIEAGTPAQSVDAPATGWVTSQDGTRIGYHQLGSGPGIILVHGAMESGLSHLELARQLADQHTVYLPDRRGRGLSGPFGSGYALHSEVEDLKALLVATGTRDVFGVSAGGLIALQAALELPAIERVAAFEPALSIDGSAPTAFLVDFDRQIAAGRTAAALVTGMKAAQMGPPIFNRIPSVVIEQLTRLMMAAEDRKAGPGDVTMRKLAPTLHYDFQLVAETEPSVRSFGAIRPAVLLLGASQSPAYLKLALDTVAGLLPGARRVEFAGFDHGASGNRNRGGHPVQVAHELREFFAQPGPSHHEVPVR
ncbi:MAG TPA: alpha/beta hydrolase [Candidatus Limnocylindrales bacterium]|nr:alpha/beta hydrolase [Candidatus Limnocylindrales bacterium]